MTKKFSDAAEKEFMSILSRYPKKDAALLPILWLAQKEFGYLSRDVQAYVAEKLGLSLARVESVVSFYTLYKTKPMGKYHLQVCRNISCNLKGSESLMKVIESELNIKSGETTQDQLFTYSQVECLAACGGGPAMQVNGDYYEHLNEESLRELLKNLRNDGKNHH